MNAGACYDPDVDTALPMEFLRQALEARMGMIKEPHRGAFRLFNGFYEGIPWLVIDLYGRTLVVNDYRDPAGIDDLVLQTVDTCRSRLSWVQGIIWKPRNHPDPEIRRGRVLTGDRLDRKVLENGTWYAIELLLHQDSTLFLDTRLLRKWLQENSREKTVLNTFSYTGSLGAAALAGGAARVLQTDLDRKFLNVAKDTYSLNGFPIRREDFITGDFFPIASRLRRTNQQFDIVILDPPFFSSTTQGRVDLLADTKHLVNKLRPLVKDGGRLIAVNNAVYKPGSEYIRELESLSEDGYLELEGTIPVPADFTGTMQTQVSHAFVDPFPFNHSTKIAILKIKRKQQI
jgi:23S rRNA (cytosine1962-C5)-methyltransferase